MTKYIRVRNNTYTFLLKNGKLKRFHLYKGRKLKKLIDLYDKGLFDD